MTPTTWLLVLRSVFHTGSDGKYYFQAGAISVAGKLQSVNAIVSSELM
jgi:hypothetical protein